MGVFEAGFVGFGKISFAILIRICFVLLVLCFFFKFIELFLIGINLLIFV